MLHCSSCILSLLEEWTSDEQRKGATRNYYPFSWFKITSSQFSRTSFKPSERFTIYRANFREAGNIAREGEKIDDESDPGSSVFRSWNTDGSLIWSVTAPNLLPALQTLQLAETNFLFFFFFFLCPLDGTKNIPPQVAVEIHGKSSSRSALYVRLNYRTETTYKPYRFEGNFQNPIYFCGNDACI